ncbi:MAG: hypothetical protein M5U11_14645 [Anaerolineales bacterium]|jgi:hypothetical protein|nr:hypothetical protein [Anaerolineales bacterium]MDX9935792.1 hypothetical protein [Anaerolineales bacterium]GER79713.1 hypothetical protein DIM_17940 [Candidatus Denitrolinea symbiosum]HPP63283.1 hypothetical protein [Anaerolineales bacterium]
MKLKSFLRALAFAALGTGVIVLADHLGGAYFPTYIYFLIWVFLSALWFWSQENGWQPYERMSK